MAKVGEGDARWIVQDRADGTNVHGWHWAERDVLKWSKSRLTELLGNLSVLNGEDQVFISISSIESVTGEALVNNRKKKLIPSYELAVKGQWTGEINDGSQNSVASASGSFQLPYISDENADEDPELTVSLAEEGAGQQRLKQAFVTKGKKVRGCCPCFSLQAAPSVHSLVKGQRMQVSAMQYFSCHYQEPCGQCSITQHHRHWQLHDVQKHFSAIAAADSLTYTCRKSSRLWLSL